MAVEVDEGYDLKDWAIISAKSVANELPLPPYAVAASAPDERVVTDPQETP